MNTIPFEIIDDVRHLDSGKWSATLVLMPNVPFTATFEFTSLVGNNNRFGVVDVATGETYSIFPSDMIDYIKRGLIVGGMISGLWLFSKRNTAYGVRLG